MSAADLKTEIENQIADTQNQITDSEVFCDTSAETNAVDWGVDNYKFDVSDLVIGNDDARLPLKSYHVSGEQLENMGICGDELTGDAVVVFDDDGVVTYEEITAEVVDWT